MFLSHVEPFFSHPIFFHFFPYLEHDGPNIERIILEKNFGNNRAQDDFNIVSEPWITYRAFSWSDHRQRERIPVSHFSEALLTQGTECNVENSQKKLPFIWP